MIDANIERILDDDAVGGRDVVVEVAVAGNVGQRVDACCIEPDPVQQVRGNDVIEKRIAQKLRV